MAVPVHNCVTKDKTVIVRTSCTKSLFALALNQLCDTMDNYPPNNFIKWGSVKPKIRRLILIKLEEIGITCEGHAAEHVLAPGFLPIAEDCSAERLTLTLRSSDDLHYLELLVKKCDVANLKITVNFYGYLPQLDTKRLIACLGASLDIVRFMFPYRRNSPTYRKPSGTNYVVDIYTREQLEEFLFDNAVEEQTLAKEKSQLSPCVVQVQCEACQPPKGQCCSPM